MIRMKVLRNTSSASQHIMKSSGRAPHGMGRLVPGSVHPGLEPNHLRDHEAGLGVVQLAAHLAQSTQSQPCAPGLAPAATPRPAVPSRHILMVIRSPEDGGNDHLARLRDLVDLEHREHLAHDLLVDLDDGGWSCSSRDDPCC